MKNEILCIGEILWDALPLGLFLGGAPFNVACHLHEIGEDVAMVSRVGDDVLGQEALRRLRGRGMSAELVQTDASLPTGFVEVSFEEDGSGPEYLIVEPAAWDAIQYTEDLSARTRSAAAVVFGTLAQRAAASRETIRAACNTEAVKVLDVNLRPPFVSRTIVESSLRAADVVKLNDDELGQLQAWFGLPEEPPAALSALADRFGCEVVCVTQGAGGALLWKQGELFEHPGYAVEVEDTVGAGDAFLAALLSALLREAGGREILDEANRLGAYVATQFGGTPTYEIDTLKDSWNPPLQAIKEPAEGTL